VTTLAITGSTWVEVIILLSIVVPVTAASVLAWFVLRGARNDPDEQRWRRLAEQRRSETDQRS
jgi:hypothetical protein